MIYGWSPQIGDPTIWGWLTVLNYLAALCLAIWATRVDWRNANFWLFVSLSMLALGINKQLDLQGLVVAIGREVAFQNDWYGDRRMYQKWFIELIAASSLALTAALVYWSRKSGKPVIVATIGIVLTAAFVVARAASFHHMDAMLSLTFVALKLNHILENTGIGLVVVGAIWAVRSKTRPKTPRPRSR